jgi:hypothetical protein
MLMNRRSRPTVALVAVIVLATAAFGIGAALEKSEHHNEGSESAAQPGNVATASGSRSDTILISGESAESGGEAGESGESGHSESGGESHSEDLVGIDPESTALVVLAIVGSLVLAAAVWLWPEAIPVLAMAGLAMFFFCALDIREAVHQWDESRGGLMALALGVAALHLVAGGLAIWLAGVGQRKASHVAA